MRKKKGIVLLIMILFFSQLSISVRTIHSEQRITDYSNTTQSTDDTYEDDDTFGTANSIDLNTVQVRTVFPIADLDYVYFELDTYYSVVIETLGPSGDTGLWLYDSTLSLIGFDDDSGTDYFSRITLWVLVPGTYYIMVDEFGNDNVIDSYNLSLTATATHDMYEFESLHSPSELAYNSTQVRSINPIGDEDFFTFELTAICNVTLETSGVGDTVMGICYDISDYENTKIVEDDESGEANNAKIFLSDLSAATYYVKVWDFGNNGLILNYSLHLTVVSSAYSDSQVPTMPFTFHEEPLSSTEIIVQAEFHDTCEISCAKVKYQVNFGVWLESKFIEYYPTHYNATLGSFNLGDAVSYYIEAIDNSSNANVFTSPTYNFTVVSNDNVDLFEKDNGFSYAGELAFDVNQTRRIHPVGDLDISQFVVPLSGTIEIETFGSSGNTYLRLYAENKTLIAYDDANGTNLFSRIEMNLIAGTYYVAVTENGNDAIIDNYVLSLSVYDEIEPTPTPPTLRISLFSTLMGIGSVTSMVLILIVLTRKRR